MTLVIVFCDRDVGQHNDDDLIHMGHAILTFYSALIDLLGRCAPEMHVSVLPICLVSADWCSKMSQCLNVYMCLRKFERHHIRYVTCFQLIQGGKGEAIRIRAILRSLIPIQDLEGVISISFRIPAMSKGISLTIVTII